MKGQYSNPTIHLFGRDFEFLAYQKRGSISIGFDIEANEGRPLTLKMLREVSDHFGSEDISVDAYAGMADHYSIDDRGSRQYGIEIGFTVRVANPTRNIPWAEYPTR